MFKSLYDFASQLVFLSRDTQENKAEIKALQAEMKEVRQELRDLTQVVQHLAVRMQHNNEVHHHEREKLALALENQLLRFERRLRPGSGSTENQG